MLEIQDKIMARESFELQNSNNIFEEEAPSIHDSFSFSQRESARGVLLNDEIEIIEY